MVTILRPKSLGEDRWVTIFNLGTGDILATCLLGLKSDKIDVVSYGDTMIDLCIFRCSRRKHLLGSQIVGNRDQSSH